MFKPEKLNQNPQETPPQEEQLPPQRPIEEQKEVQLRKGDIVRIQRSDGTIESGWEILGFDPNTDDVMVGKLEKRGLLRKRISQTKLKNLNRP
jgi:hypothetical protein